LIPVAGTGFFRMVVLKLNIVAATKENKKPGRRAEEKRF
jgi:hypothetical protein